MKVFRIVRLIGLLLSGRSVLRQRIHALQCVLESKRALQSAKVLRLECEVASLKDENVRLRRVLVDFQQGRTKIWA